MEEILLTRWSVVSSGRGVVLSSQVPRGATNVINIARHSNTPGVLHELSG